MAWYRALLHLFPRAFRQRFGRDMAEVFDDRWRATRRQGRWALVALAIRTIGDVGRHAAAERRARRARRPQGDTMLRTLARDVRFATRAFRRQPIFTTVALATIALGIGANVAIFSVVRPLLLTPLPYPDADRIVAVYEHPIDRPDDKSVASPVNFDAWERRTDIFASLAGYSGGQATLTGAGDPVRLRLATATASLFDVFGIGPLVGRAFTDAEALAGAHVVVLGEPLWRSRFGADTSIVGRSISLDGEPWQVVGVLPERFCAPFCGAGRAEAWRPLALTAALRADRTTRFLGVAGRLAPGVSIDTASAAVAASMAQLNAAFPKFNAKQRASAVSWRANSVSRVARGLWMLQAVAIGVLLIAGANLANLLMAHGASRSREFAVRAAIGAGRAQLVRQVLIEGSVLAVAGGAIGVAAAAWAVPAIAALAPTWLPGAPDLAVRMPDVVAALALSVAAGLLFSALPALFVTRGRVSIGDFSARGSTSSQQQRRTRAWLVAAQVAVALVLLSGAGLLTRSFVQLTAQPIGFSTDHVLTAELSLPRAAYAAEPERRQLFTSLIDRIAVQPGVVSATASSALPFTWWEWMDGFRVLGQAAPETISAAYRVVTPGYFDTMAVPLLRGRGFSAADAATAPRVAVANDTFARAYARFGDVVGLALQREGTEAPITIVGVSGDTRHRSFERPAQPELYLPVAQWGPTSMTLAVRTAGDPMRFAPVLRRELAALDPSLPLAEVRPLTAWVGDAVAERRFYMVLLGLFAGIAGLLAAGGIYGVMAYLVSLRMREIGIRLALGATSRGVRAMVIRQGMLPVLFGLTVGLVATLATSRVLEDQLFQLEPRDPVTIGAAAGLFVLAALAACWIPSRRTTSADPAIVLRE